MHLLGKNQPHILLKVHLGIQSNVLTFQTGLLKRTNEDTTLFVTVLLSESKENFIT